MPTVFDQSENDCLKYCRHPICSAWTIWIFSRHSTANPAKRIAVESEEIPCPAKMSRRKAGLRAKQGISELVDLGGPNKNLWCFAGGIKLMVILMQ